VEEITDQALETPSRDGYSAIKAVRSIADGMPAFGIIAAVLGVMHTMESVNLPPAELGKLIAAALVGTFLGILTGLWFCRACCQFNGRTSGSRLVMLLNALKKVCCAARKVYHPL